MITFSKRLFPRLLLCLLCAAPACLAQGELYSDADIGIQLGQARRDHGLSLTFQAGMGNTFFAPGFAYEHFFDEGMTMVHIPFNVWWSPEEPEHKVYDASNLLFGTGCFFRRLVFDVASSPFYGVGMRIWHITSTYERRPSAVSVEKFEFSYLNFIPVVTGGWTHRLTANWSVTGSVEVGWLFSSYDEHGNLKEDPATGMPPSTDPQGDPPWSESGFHWTVEVAGSYLF